MAPASATYQPRATDQGVLHTVIRRHLETFLAEAARGTAGASLPGFVEQEFYLGRERFHLFRTCNVWTVRALRAAGLPVRDALTTEGLMAQARRLGRVVQAAPGG